MSGPKAGPVDPKAALLARSIEYVRRLPHEHRDRIAAWAGAPAPGRKDDPVEACVAAAASAEGARRIVAAIERDAREVLFLESVFEEALPATDIEGRARDFFGWPKARARAALGSLLSNGLIAPSAPSSRGLEALPALRLGLGPDLLAWFAGAADDAAPPMPLVRRLALLLAHAHADPVTVTAQRSLSVRWMDRTQEVFGSTAFTATFLTDCLSFLQEARAIGAAPAEPHAREWRVEPRTPAVFAADPAAVALAFAGTNDRSGWGSLVGTLAVLERLRLAGDARPTIQTLSEAGKAWVDERGPEQVSCSAGHFSLGALAAAVRTLREIGLASPARVDGTLRVARTTPTTPPPRPFRCTVLPTFEIWVAEDADPAGTADLGRIADLTSADRVAKFTLTQRSVMRAGLAPGGARAAIERLAAAAEHGLPDNVRSTLEGWARRATPLRAYRGAVVVAATDEQAAFLRGRPGILDEIAPRAFHVESLALDGILQAADKAGHPLAPLANDQAPFDVRALGRRTPDYAAEAAALLARIERWTRSKPVEPAPTPKRPPLPAVPEDPSPAGFAGEEPMTLGFLRREWPEIAAAVKADPWLQGVALRLTEDQLDDVMDLDVGAQGIRRELQRLGREHPAPAPGTPRAAPGSAAPASATQEPGPWITPPPGALVEILTAASLGRLELDIVYVLPTGGRAERRILPLEVARAGKRDVLDAQLVDDGTRSRFEVDRIVAVRLVIE